MLETSREQNSEADNEPKRAGLGSRLGWGIADQVLSSATNFGLAWTVARSVSVEAFGAFALAWGGYLISCGICRATISEPFSIIHSSKGANEVKQPGAAATGANLEIGLVISVVALFVGIFSSGELRWAFLAMAISMPGLMLQDGWRYFFFAAGRGKQAFLNDLIWSGLLVIGVIFINQIQSPSVPRYVLAWGAAATGAAAAGVVQAKFRPVLRGGLTSFRLYRHLSGPYLAEFMVNSGTLQLSFVVLSFASGIQAVGTLRGGYLLIGPLIVLYLGTSLALLPIAVEFFAKSIKRLKNALSATSLSLGVVAAIWGILVVNLPPQVGVRLLNETWLPARSVFVPLSIGTVFGGLTAGPLIGLRALGASRTSLRVALLTAPMTLLGAVLGSLFGDAKGAAAGLALGAFVTALVAWRLYASALAAVIVEGRNSPTQIARPSEL